MRRVLYVAYKHGVLWNVTHEKGVVDDWFERCVIEGWESYVLTGEEKWHENYPSEFE